MGNENLNHNSLVPLHDQLIKQNAEDIKEIKSVTNGLPQTIERIEYVVISLSKNFEKFLEVADKKYQTKEMCDVCVENNEKQVADVNKRVDGIEKKYDYLFKGVIAVLISIVGFAAKYGLDILTQILTHATK